ncbi:MAG: aspartate kinase [Nitrospinae bacterium]|nr:aspartate kinase [Nitrospinota bacterium]
MRRIRWVIKLGGSLARAGALDRVGKEIARLARGRALVIVPGGGSYADEVRRWYARGKLSLVEAHELAILAMNGYGADVARAIPGVTIAQTLAAARRALAKSGMVVIAPHPLAARDRAIPASWDATSDTIAARLCRRLGFGGLILVKSADAPAPSLSARAAAKGARALTDPLFPRFINPRWDVFVVNGGRPDAMAMVLKNGAAPGAARVTGR